MKQTPDDRPPPCSVRGAGGSLSSARPRLVEAVPLVDDPGHEY
jgi:hypothetical protein